MLMQAPSQGPFRRRDDTTPKSTSDEHIPYGWLTFDLDTHGWPDHERRVGKQGERGQFGHTQWADPASLKYARIVKLSWQIYGEGKLLRKEERLISGVPPIQYKAARCHNITDEMVAQDGVPIGWALSDFMKDLQWLISDGGQLVAHNIEFAAGIVHAELDRLVESVCRCETHPTAADVVAFTRAAEAAFCSMDASIQRPYPLMPSIEEAYKYLMRGAAIGPRQDAAWRAAKAAEMYRNVVVYGLP